MDDLFEPHRFDGKVMTLLLEDDVTDECDNDEDEVSSGVDSDCILDSDDDNY